MSALGKDELDEDRSERRLRRQPTEVNFDEVMSPPTQVFRALTLPFLARKRSIRANFSAKAMWHKAFYRIRAQRAIGRANLELIAFGTNELIDESHGYRRNIDELLERKIRKTETFRSADHTLPYMPDKKLCLFYPDSVFLQCWNTVLTLLMVYLATVSPYRIAFSEDVFFDGWMILELAIDGFFIVDLAVNFCICYRLPNGRVVDSRSLIAKRYVQSWFLIDLMSSVPFSLMDIFINRSDDSGRMSKFLKLTRLPRLYKLLRLAKLARFLKIYENTPFYDRIEEFCQERSRFKKLLRFSALVFLCIHIMACFWYFAARFNDFGPDTWLARFAYTDEPQSLQYLAALYWAVTTMVTVGYGDITAKTEEELVIAITWVMIGVSFYTYTIGTLSSFLISIDTKDSVLAAKMAAINEFTAQTGISQEVKMKVRDAVRYTMEKMGNIWSDKHSLFEEMPKGLQYDVAQSMFGGVIKDLHFFHRRGRSFVLYFIPILRPLVLSHEEYLYKEAESADEMYFIAKGRVNLVLLPSDISYKSYPRGSYLGDIEIVKSIRRIDNAQVDGETELLAVFKAEFLKALALFPADAKEIRRISNERYARHKHAKIETMHLLRLKRHYGSLRPFRGRQMSITLPPDIELSPGEYLEKYALYRVVAIEKSELDTRQTLLALTAKVEELQNSVNALCKIR